MTADIPAHLRGLSPKDREVIRAAAAKTAADLPPLSEETLAFLRTLFARTAVADRKKAS